MYKIQAQQSILSTLALYPHLDNEALRTSFIIINDNLNIEQLRSIFTCADCYVSPYRAEGFNLPVIEAMACGVPVIVSDKGATDDFVGDDAAKIETILKPNCELPEEAKLYYNTIEFHLEPDFDSLLDLMEQRINYPDNAINASQRIRENYSWNHVTNTLISTFQRYCL